MLLPGALCSMMLTQCSQTVCFRHPERILLKLELFNINLYTTLNLQLRFDYETDPCLDIMTSPCLQNVLRHVTAAHLALALAVSAA